MQSTDYIALEDAYGARNYHPLDVVIERAEGPWVYDVEGKKYLDCLSAYSAVSQGHCHPHIVDALTRQAQKATLVSRAFRSAELPLFLKSLAQLSGLAKALPMNSGTEAVETALKVVRKWGYQKKGIPSDRAEVIVCSNNFHGRSITIVGFSSEKEYREGFGPFAGGFVEVPFGDIDALEQAITPHTAAFLVEPIQGEGGIIIPPDGYLKAASELCRRSNVLFVADEIQSGLGRCGTMFACDHEQVVPDILILGKALSGGVLPISAVVARDGILDVIEPGQHGSTFGGNPLAAAVGKAALEVIVNEKLVDKSRDLGSWFLGELQKLKPSCAKEIRGRGLLIGIELKQPARPYCEALQNEGILCKETHDTVIRIAPPLVITKDELQWAFERFKKVLV